jgi:hypothetical protein
MKALICLVVAALLAGCATVEPAGSVDTLDAIARDYVVQTLEIGQREEGFVDAYYGPPELQAAAKTNPRTIPELAAATNKLLARLDAIQPGDAMDAHRQAFLRGQLVAEQTRLRMLQGEKLTFTTEARGLFGVAPELKPLSSYDPILATIDRLLPGDGPLSDRVDAYENKFNIPPDRVKPVMDAAIAECRRRTAEHIQLPANEHFDLALVTDKPWGGYNYYQGNAHSKIEVNTDLPIRLSRAVDLGCHEGYPGHHVYNALLEQNLTRGRSWIEFSVYPLYSPQSLIAEGSANYGIDLAFPGDEQPKFEAAILYPLAGLPASEAERYHALQKAKLGLDSARFTIIADYLDGRVGREQTIALLQKYNVQSRARAEKSVSFADTYRSYIINYGLGQDMVRAYVEAAGPGQDARWARMAELLSNPTTPADLQNR